MCGTSRYWCRAAEPTSRLYWMPRRPGLSGTAGSSGSFRPSQAWFALDRAKRHGIETAVVERKACESPEEFDAAILRELEGCGADIVVLAGFLSILGPTVISRYENRILNVHPALIPSFCGKGYYGLRVHEEALRYGVKLTGATVHFVSEVPDGGAILLQKAVDVRPDDTPESLQRRVMEEAEWQLLPRAVSLVCEGRVRVEGRIAHILDGDGNR